VNPFSLSPDRVLEEAVTFNKRLASGFETLSGLGDVEPGSCEKDAVYSEDKLVLYRYRPLREDNRIGVPLLITYALVNRPYVVDLQPDRSLVRAMLESGLDVYLIDWGYPDGADRFLGLDDYINGYLKRCVDHVRAAHELDAINLLGICQGGTFSMCFAALYPERVRNLITMVAPVDFQTPDNLLSHWTQDMDVDLLVDTLGNIPGEMLNWTYLSLKPFRLTGQKYLGLVDILEDRKQTENFLRMEKWIFDSPDQAGEAFREFTRDFYQKNLLMKGGLEIGGKKVDLSKITMPVLNIYATEDHLVPPDASRPLEKLVGTEDYTAVEFKGGHIGIYVSSRAQRQVPPAIHDWIAARV